MAGMDRWCRTTAAGRRSSSCAKHETSWPRGRPPRPEPARPPWPLLLAARGGLLLRRLAVAARIVLDRRERGLQSGHEVRDARGRRSLGLHGDLLAGCLALDQVEHLVAVLVAIARRV